MASFPLLSRRHLVMTSLAAALPGHRARAQGTPRATEPDTVVWQPIGSDDLPRNGIARLSHIVLAPGEELPRFALARHAVLLVVAGSVEAFANSETFVFMREGRNISPVRLGLPAGGGVMVGPRSHLTVMNDSSGTAELLLLEVGSAGDDGMPDPASTPAPDSPMRQIATAPVTFLAHRGGLFVEQRVEAAGSSAVSSTWRGVELGAIAAGTATILATRGSVRVMPVDGSGERSTTIGERIDVAAGDRYICADGSLVWRSGNMEPLVVQRALVVPALQPTAR